MKTVAIIGAGPAGLSAAYQFLLQSNKYQVTIYEKDTTVGGLSKTLEFDGGRVDIGGHRFFTNNKDILNLWKTILPLNKQGMLIRERKSHILWNKKLISYPLQLNTQTLYNLGLFTSIKVLLSYFHTKFQNQTCNTLEDFYKKRFGKELYSLFFKDYTHKLWGIPAKNLSSDWGSQRIQKISLGQLLYSLLPLAKNTLSQERSLITQFYYPALGAGQLWDNFETQILKLGGIIEKNCCVDRLIVNDSYITSIEYTQGTKRFKKKFDIVLSSMPLNELITAIDTAPTSVKKIGNRLRYRDMIIVALELSPACMGSLFQLAKKDCWIYTQDKSISFGRIQILNNWSPYAVNTSGNIVLELEFFCNKNDSLWNSDDFSLILYSIETLKQCSLCNKTATAKSYLVKRIEKAYPIYTDGYYQLNVIKKYLNTINNLYCIGRNGQHRYNNMDHSIESGIVAAQNVINERNDKENLWNVNTNKEYIEKR